MNEKKFEIKILVVGDMGVGKSCISRRYAFDTFTEDYMTTYGIGFFDKSVVFEEYNNIPVNMKIFDTAGQEKYQSLSSIFFKDAPIVILVFDVNRIDTFESIKSFWYPRVMEEASKEVSKKNFFNF